jgi:dTDP-glucose 4,6-dehydratase
MATYLVIGANSFSGQDFVDLLLDDPASQVIAISRSAELPAWRLRFKERADLSRYRFVRIDLNRDMVTLLALLESERPANIVNFAAQSEVGPSWEHPEHWFQTNTVALACLVNFMRRQTWLERYLHISSPEAYGNCVGTVTEATPDNPSTPYAASKAAADMIVSVYQRQYGLPALFIRATNIYGARQQLFKIIPRTAIYVRSGRRLALHGGGVAVKSYIHVRDVSRGELAVLHQGDVGQRYHLSPDDGVAVRDVVAMVARRFGKTLDEVADIAPERPGQDAAYVIDSTRARQTLGWAPQVGLEQGIDEVCGWVDRFWNEISRAEHDYVHQA